MKYKIAYILYLIVCLLYPVTPIFGPISLRHILIVIMLIWSVIDNGVAFDRFLKWFCLFLFLSALGPLVSGYAGPFLNRLLGTYLAAIVVYISTKIVIKKYNGGRLVLFVVLAVAILNSIVAIGQFYGSPIATILPVTLRINMSEEMIEFYENIEDFHGRYVGGILGIVTSGYFLSSASILSLYNSKGKIKIYNWLLFAFLFFALFLVQERSGLLAAVMCVFIYLIVNVVNNGKTIIPLITAIIVAVVFISYYGGQLVDINEMRYVSEGFSDSSRIGIMSTSWHVFLDNPMGGIDAYKSLGVLEPHFVFVNAFLYGGLFGGIVVSGIILGQLFLVFKILFESFRREKHSSILIVFSIAYLCHTLSSCFHNPSLVSGDVMFFVFWGAIIALLETETSIDYRQTLKYSSVIKK